MMIQCHNTFETEIEVQPPEYAVSTVLIVSTIVHSCTADIGATPHIIQGKACMNIF